MQVNLIHLDGALAAQDDFLRAAGSAQHLHVEKDGPAVRLWSKQPALDALQKKIAAGFMGSGPWLKFMGSGDFHHVTALLLAEVARRYPQPFTLIHFDNHPDWVKFSGGMHCGSWLNAAHAIPNLKRALTLGLCSDDINSAESAHAKQHLIAPGFLEIFPYADFLNPNLPLPLREGSALPDSWSGTSRGAGERNKFINFFLTRIPTENIYITLDKDVLSPTDAVTNWDQGKMRLDDVIHIINAIGTQHQIIGADVIGDYSQPEFSGPSWQKLMKYGEVFLDHPRARPTPATAIKINARTNIRLLEAFSVLMA